MAKVWRWPGDKAAWHFVSVPKDISQKITKSITVRRGWGSVRVEVRIGKSSWQTSIFPDKRSGTYLLPLKARIRKIEGLDEGETILVFCKRLE